MRMVRDMRQDARLLMAWRTQLVNVFIDAFAGFIPILGNMVDFAFKSNLANLGILESHLRHSPKSVYDCQGRSRADSRPSLLQIRLFGDSATEELVASLAGPRHCRLVVRIAYSSAHTQTSEQVMHLKDIVIRTCIHGCHLAASSRDRSTPHDEIAADRTATVVADGGPLCKFKG